MEPLTEMSALVLARGIRSGHPTSRAVVEAHIELLTRVNPTINAVVADRYDMARREADAADARIAAASPADVLPPLLGVPCTVKESLAVAGMPHSAGVVARHGYRAESTAPVVQRVLDAGAIVLGVTNTSEMCLWVESENRLYGRTRNPYDPERIAGGSSGGEAAAIGSGGSPFGLGSDIGGSIRIPAFCCGVFGHKPSLGVVPATGGWPPLSGESGRLYSNGPLARRAEDLMPLLCLMAGPDGVDPHAIPVELGDPAQVSLDGLTVLLSEDAWLLAPSEELLAARERAAGALAAAGARIRRRPMPGLRRAVEAYITTLARSSDTTARQVLGAAGADEIGWRALLRRGGPHTVATRILLVAEQAHARLPDAVATRLVAAGRQVSAQIAAAVGDGVLLHPPLARTAPRHGRTVGRPWHLAHAVPFNLAGVPVTQVPLGLGRYALPVGVQVVAGYLRDHVSIAVALELERVFGGWVPPARSRYLARRAAART
jgi:fatty acid amide hydrolase 2